MKTYIDMEQALKEKNNYRFDEILSIVDSLLQHNNYALLLTKEQFNILKEWNDWTNDSSNENYSYKGHKIILKK